MACKFPAFLFEGIGNDSSFLDLCLTVEIRMLFQPFCLIFLEMFFCLIIGVGTITEDSVVTGESDKTSGTFVSAVGMFL